MLILALDTSTRRVGVAIGNDEGLLGEVAIGGPATRHQPRHTEQLAPAIEFLCHELGTPLGSMSAIAVSIGPGMFTGLRVGVVTAKTLAQALSVPVVPIASLDLLAYPLRLSSRVIIAPLIDARRNEVYFALYLPVPGGVQRITDYSIGSADDVVAELAAHGREALVCGDGALRFRDAFVGHDLIHLAGVGHASPSLAALVELACGRVEREEFCSAAEVTPMYLRRSDAEIAAERSATIPDVAN
jgi:tRNA threonylcarbamoyladenosine biosynthesis protein TsaB